MRKLLFFIFLTLSFSSLAETMTNLADKIVANEVAHRVKIRELQRKAEIAEIEDKIRGFKQEEPDLDIGLSVSAPVSIASPAAESIIESPVPRIEGYRNEKGLFRQGKTLLSAGKGDLLPGGFKIIEVTADSATIQLPSGRRIEQQINWAVTEVDYHDE